MEARQAVYFLAVVDHGGFSRAATVLEVSQPTLSQSVRALERELGAELFHRTGRGLVLSAAGRALLGPARELARDMAAARASVGRTPEWTVLDLVAAAPLGVYPGAALVGSFRRRHPEILVRLDKPDDDEVLLGMVRDGSSDLGLGYLPVAHLGLEVSVLGEHELRLAFPPEQQPRSEPVPLARLEGLRLIGIPAGNRLRSIVEDALRASGVRTRLIAEIAQLDTIIQLVVGGVGAAFLVAPAAEEAARRGARVSRIEPPLVCPYGLVRRAGTASAPARAFLAHATSGRPAAGVD
jgi:DNA-binding transcriptional LysR family regulator